MSWWPMLHAYACMHAHQHAGQIWKGCVGRFKRKINNCEAPADKQHGRGSEVEGGETLQTTIVVAIR